MSLPRIDPNMTVAELEEACEEFLEAGHLFFEKFHKCGKYGAVVWATDKSGALVLFTRGEYRSTLLKNIEAVGPITSFGSASEEDE